MLPSEIFCFLISLSLFPYLQNEVTTLPCLLLSPGEHRWEQWETRFYPMQCWERY